jgi:hypothetical protein
VLPESDSEYEYEEIVELCEWYPPDFWRSNLKPGEEDERSRVQLTDVTVDQLTVTMKESTCGGAGFFTKSLQ